MADTVKIIAEFQDNATGAIKQLEDAISKLSTQAKQVGDSASSVNKLTDSIKQAGESSKHLDKLGGASAGTRRELLVLAHEMSQGSWKNFASSLIVLGERTDALGGAFRLLAAGGGTVGVALGAIAASVAAVGLAYHQAHAQTKEFNAAMYETSNYAGMTSDTFKMMGAQVASASHSSYGTASEAVLGLAKSGKFTQEQIKLLSTVIINESRMSGIEIDKLTENFVKLADGPTKFMNSFNTAHHNFTPAQQQQIRLLEATGRTQEAVTVAAQAFAAWQNGPGKKAIEDHLSLIDKEVIGLGLMWDAFKRMVGAEKLPLAEQLKAVNVEIEKALANGKKMGDVVTDPFGNVSRGDNAEWQSLQAKKTAIMKQMAKEQAKAIGDAANAQYSQLAQEGSDYLDSLGVKTTGGLEKALAKLKQKVQEAQLVKDKTGTSAEILKPEVYNQAKEKIINSYKNPIDDSKAKAVYQAYLQMQEDLIRESADYAKLMTERAKEDMAKGIIDEVQYAARIKDIKMVELGEQAFYTQAKLDAATKEADRTHGIDVSTVREKEKFAGDIKHIHNEELIANAQYNTELAKQSEQVQAIYTRMVNDITKASDTRSTAIQREFNKLTMSSNEAALDDAKNTVVDKFAALKDKTAAELKLKHSTVEFTKKALAEIDAAEQEALGKEKDYYDKRLAIQNDWKTGATKAFKDYQEAAANQADHFKTLVEGLTKGFEDTIFNFMQTGKLSFAELGNTFKSMIDRMVAQALTAQLQKSLFGGGFGSGGGLVSQGLGWIASMFGGGKASGGEVQAGKIYQVNENGKELFRPAVSGTVIPLGGAQPNAGNTFQFNITAMDSQDVRRALERDNRWIADLVNKSSRAYNLGV